MNRHFSLGQESLPRGTRTAEQELKVGVAVPMTITMYETLCQTENLINEIHSAVISEEVR